MAVQTTTESRQPEDLHSLTALIEAQRRRIAFLEFILTQRTETTRNRYQQLKKHFSRMQDLIYKIFLDNPAIGFSYDMLTEEFKARYPNVSSVNVNRRVRELAQQGRLWRTVDKETGKVKHYLRLDEQKEVET